MNFSSIKLNQDYIVKGEIHLDAGVSGWELQKLSASPIKEIENFLDLMLSNEDLKKYLIGERDVNLNTVPENP